MDNAEAEFERKYKDYKCDCDCCGESTSYENIEYFDDCQMCPECYNRLDKLFREIDDLSYDDSRIFFEKMKEFYPRELCINYNINKKEYLNGNS